MIYYNVPIATVDKKLVWRVRDENIVIKFIDNQDDEDDFDFANFFF